MPMTYEVDRPNARIFQLPGQGRSAIINQLGPMCGSFQMRFQRIMEGFDSADRSQALSGMAYRTPDLDLLP